MALAAAPTLLVADSDRCFSERVRASAESLRWSVIQARDGPAALDVLCSAQIGLVVIAAELPLMDGLSVVGAARARGRDFSFVCVDSSPAPELTRRALSQGALACISRAALTDALPEILRRAADNKGGSATSPTRLSAGSRLRLCILSGPLSGNYAARVVDGESTSVILSAWGPDGSPVDLPLATPVTVGFAGPRGWGEFNSRIAGSYVRGEIAELALAPYARVAYTDRRGAERLVAALPVRVWPAGASRTGSQMVWGRTEDIGELGLRACLDGELGFPGKVVLSVPPGDGQRGARLVGAQAWHQAMAGGSAGHRYGFRFVDLTPEGTEALGALLERIRSWANEPSADREGRDEMLLGDGPSPPARHD